MNPANILWECLWKTSVVTLAIWLATLLLRRRSAALRHALWLGSLTAFVVVPPLVMLARRSPPIRVSIHVPAALETLPVAALTTGPPSARAGTRTWRVDAVWGWIWLGGVLVPGIRRGRAVARMRGIARRAQPAPASLTKSLDARFPVRISAEVQTPLTFGLIRPVILLPPCAIEWSRELLKSVLEHEQEHIRRYDPLAHWMAELVCVTWWFHPLAWLARSRAAHERECACDDAVLRSGVRPGDYASELLNLAATLPKKGEPVMALSALSDFERRIRNLLLHDTDRRAASAGTRLGAALATCALIVPLALLHAQTPSGLGDLSGTVTDMSGARVPNALITASGSTGNREVTRADAAGEWTLAGIPAGNYTVEAAAPGFALASNSIALAAGQKTTLPQSLSVGNIRQTINVVAQGQARRTADQSTGSPQRIKVGGNVQASKLLRQVKPAYPASAKAQGIEGTVLLSAVISKEGDLLSVTVMNKLADPDLAAVALDAVKQWHYEPTLLNGEPVEVVTTITVNFQLQM